MIEGLVSVIMTNYNTPEDCLRAAIDSILNQTYTNFEFIIIDDGSTDNSLVTIRSYSDSRIRVYSNEQNIGLTKSLNKGIELANGEFIARMDSDDISEVNRFERQIAFLKSHPNVVVCGSWARLFGNWKEAGYSNEVLKKEIPDRETYRVMLLFGNYPNIVHSSAMFNNVILKKNNIKYNEKYIYAQDYRMWVECSKYYDCSIVPEILLQFRVRAGTISTGKKEIQQKCALGIMEEQLNALGIDFKTENELYHVNLLNSRGKYNKNQVEWIKTLIEANREKGVYNQKIFEEVLWKKWAEIVYFSLRDCGFTEKMEHIGTIPLKYYPRLLYFWINRKRGWRAKL